jgi:hypothetical protein
MDQKSNQKSGGQPPGKPKDQPARNPMEKRHGGMRALAATLPRVASPVLGKRGFSEAQLIAQWSSVMGETLARHMAPERISFTRGGRQDGTLRLRVEPGFALEAQHREPQILERINAFFGYRAVARLALTQGPMPQGEPARPKPRPLGENERVALESRVAGIEDPGLRDALRRLGEAMIGARKS